MLHTTSQCMAMSNTSFILSWGAPFSIDVTGYPADIFNYTLCTNITIYGCKTIPSDPDCTFPRTCTSSVDFPDPSLNGTNKTIMDYGDPIVFTFFAMNGAGNGTMANFTYMYSSTKEAGLCNSVNYIRVVLIHTHMVYQTAITCSLHVNDGKPVPSIMFSSSVQ